MKRRTSPALGDAHGDIVRRVAESRRRRTRRRHGAAPRASIAGSASGLSRQRGDLARDAEVREQGRAGSAPTSITSCVSPTGSAREERRARRGRRCSAPGCRPARRRARARAPSRACRSEIAPRILRFSSLEPARHHGARSARTDRACPARTFGAPHTTSSSVARAHVDLRHVQVIGVRMRRLLDDARDDERRARSARSAIELVDRRDVRRDELAQLRRRLRRRERTRVSHSYETFIRANCSRKRTSES